MGEESPAPPSPVEEISIDSDDESPDEEHNKQSDIIRQGINQFTEQDIKKTPNETRGNRLSAGKLARRLSKVIPSVDVSDDTSDSTAPTKRAVWKGKSTAKRPGRKNMKRKLKKWYVDSPDEDVAIPTGIVRIDCDAGSPCLPQATQVGEINENQENSSPHSHIQIRPKWDKKLKPTKRLFDQNYEGSVDTEHQQMNQSQTTSNDVVFQNDTPQNVTPIRMSLRTNLNNSSINHTPNLEDLEQYGSIYTPGRRISARINNVGCCMFSPLMTPTQVPKGCQHEILVYDTPEEEYGLPVRLRRRKLLTTHKSKLSY